MVVADGRFCIAGQHLHTRELGAHDGLVQSVARLRDAHAVLERSDGIGKQATECVDAAKDEQGRREAAVHLTRPLCELQRLLEFATLNLDVGTVAQQLGQQLASGGVVVLDGVVEIPLGLRERARGVEHLVGDLRACQVRLDIAILGGEQLV